VSRIAKAFERRRAAGQAALVPYITAGDPQPDVTVGLMHALVDAGADVIELGVPFSDPMADGPVIQAACERALEHGTRLADVLDMVARFRENDADTPVVLMGYLNPIEAMQPGRFADAAAAAGVDGVLIVDLSAEEAGDVKPALRSAGLDTIFLVAPTTSEARMRSVCDNASGFLYYVSLKGVTGSNRIDVGALASRIEGVRAHTDLPIAVGFGVRTPETAAAVAAIADGVVVGSALVNRIAEHANDHEALLRDVPAALASMRMAMDASKGRRESA